MPAKLQSAKGLSVYTAEKKTEAGLAQNNSAASSAVSARRGPRVARPRRWRTRAAATKARFATSMPATASACARTAIGAHATAPRRRSGNPGKKAKLCVGGEHT